MEQTTALSLTGGWEDIVNNVERHNARVRFEIRRQQYRRNKRISKILNHVLGAALVMGLDLAGLLSSWIAVPGAMILVCIACFFGGRLWEECRG